MQMIGSMAATVTRCSKVESMIQKMLSYNKTCIMNKKGNVQSNLDMLKISYQNPASPMQLAVPVSSTINPLPPNVIYIYIYICRTAPLTSRRYILNISSTNIRTECFKHAA
jgi:hypothetical protein